MAKQWLVGKMLTDSATFHPWMNVFHTPRFHTPRFQHELLQLKIIQYCFGVMALVSFGALLMLVNVTYQLYVMDS